MGVKAKLELNVFGLVLEWSGMDRSSATITSDLQGQADNDANLGAALDAIESMVLAHFCAGINVATPAYLEGVETSCQAVLDRMA